MSTDGDPDAIYPSTDTYRNGNIHTYANTYAFTYTEPDTDSYGKHIRHGPLLLKSSSWPSAKCDAHPNWDFVRLNIVRWLR